MEKIQGSIVKVMQMCLRHLGRITRLTSVDIRNKVYFNFDHFLMERLNPQWSWLIINQNK